MKQLAFIFFLAAVLAHATASLAAGSFDPLAWTPLLRCATIFLVAPLYAFGLAVLEGAIR